MTGAELLETYPKVADAIKEFYYRKMIDSLQEDNNIPEEFKDMVKAKQFDNEYFATFIDNNPRFLFDIFDANNILIQISIDIENNCFRWSFDGGRVESNDYTSRKEAEASAVEEAFKILNEKL
jgi:hypothetical protein